MFSLQPITTLDLPELAPYRTMQWQKEHREQGIFVAEGETVVYRLLESDLPVISLLLPEERLDLYRPLLERRAESIQVYTASKSLLESMVGFSMYQGVLAIAKVPGTVSLDHLLRHAPQPLLLVAADGVSSAENIGALARSCAAFGAQALIYNETSCSPYLRRAVRNSMGTIFKLAVVEITGLDRTLQYLRSHQIQTIAAHPHRPEHKLSAADLRAGTCLVFGSEGHGISAPVLAACDQAVHIPMQNNVDSLNIASAAAVFLHEAARQRGQA